MSVYRTIGPLVYICLIFTQDKDSGYPQSIFWIKNKKKNVYPCAILKWGVMWYTFHARMHLPHTCMHAHSCLVDQVNIFCLTQMYCLMVTPFFHISQSHLVFSRTSGQITLQETLPDTVTQWLGNAYCSSSANGIGVSETVSLTSFQPFFLSVSLPYSVVRGEVVTMVVTVFNYLPHCTAVNLL